jgi:lipoprotein-anchoring transpeptidase ErfK/SrfK
LPPQPAPKGQTNWLPYLLVGGAVLAASTMAALLVALLLVVALAPARIASGVSVAGVSIGGQTAAEAQTTIMQTAAQQSVLLEDGERSQPLSLADLGIGINTDATLEAAQAATSGQTVSPVYTIDLVQTQNALIDISTRFNVEAQVGEAGRAVDIPVLLDRLRNNLTGELADGTLDLPMIETAPLEPEEVTADTYSGPTVTHVVERGQELGLIAKDYNVSVADIASLNGISNPDLLYIGQELTIPAAGEYEPTAAEAPAPSTTVGKAIVVSVSKQRIFAFENGQLVRSHLVSTGLPATPTVLGDYKIYVKYTADDMSGPGYFLPQVPYTMYFYAGYAIHGTYWHNAFGREMSHGCVNLPVDESAWFFNWASVGTPVRVVA